MRKLPFHYYLDIIIIIIYLFIIIIIWVLGLAFKVLPYWKT